MWSKDHRHPTWCISFCPGNWAPIASEEQAIDLARRISSHTPGGSEFMVGRGYVKPHGQLVVEIVGYIAPDGTKRCWRGTETMR